MPSASLSGYELRAPVLKVVYSGVIMALQGFSIRGPYQGTIGSVLDIGASIIAHVMVRYF